MRTNNNGLTAGNSQPVKTHSIVTSNFIAASAYIKRAAGIIFINLGISADCILMLALLAIVLIQGVLQWLR